MFGILLPRPPTIDRATRLDRMVARLWPGVFAAVLLGASPVRATWSIIIVDGRTMEIAVGSATCLTSFDLQRNLPVVLVDVGAACAQSLVDSNAVNRMVIWNELLNGTDPDTIISTLAALGNQHQSRQYGIADTRWRMTTFTGNNAGQWRGGATGFTGDLYYAIQGNVLTGAPVVDMAEQAVWNTPGDLSDKLMASMEAARSMGGDGRCSCSAVAPTSCGAPPPTFEKSAHIGFMIVARKGDVDGVCTAALGCANGDYWMTFNVPFQMTTDPDPVFQLQDMYNAFRANHLGRPDAVHSMVVVEPSAVPGDGTHAATLTVRFRDWQDHPVDGSTLIVSVEHDATSAGLAEIGSISPVGDGVFEVPLMTPGGIGRDRFRVVADDGVRPVVLIPLPELISAARVDLDLDGDVDLADYRAWQACRTGPDPSLPLECPDGDVDGDDDLDLFDDAEFMRAFTAPPCRVLDILQPPVPSFHPCGTPIDVSVGVFADPDAQYQWFLDGAAIPGATEATYHVESATNADHGFYSCRVANSCGSIMTNSVLVRVFPNPCP